MNKTLLIIYLTLVCFAVNGQGYHQFLKNIGWCIAMEQGTGAILQYYNNDGDTVVNTQSYVKLYKNNSKLFLAREDTTQKKIWIILPDSSSETLLYDFNLVSGNQITLNYVGYLQTLYQVDSIDSISTPLGIRKRINLSTSDTNFISTLYWIEGIGSTYGPIYLYDQTYPIDQFGYHGHILICAYNEYGIKAFNCSCGLPCGMSNFNVCPFLKIHEIENENVLFEAYFISSDLLSIEIQNDIIDFIRIFSTDGKQIDQIEITSKKEKYLVDTNKWSSGLYLIEVTLSNGYSFTKKITK